MRCRAATDLSFIKWRMVLVMRGTLLRKVWLCAAVMLVAAFVALGLSFCGTRSVAIDYLLRRDADSISLRSEREFVGLFAKWSEYAVRQSLSLITSPHGVRRACATIFGVHEIRFCGIELRDEDFHAISTIREVVSVDLSECQHSADSFKLMQACKQIRFLTLRGMKLRDTDLESVSVLPRLQSLMVSRTLVTGSAFSDYCWQSEDQLRNLDLRQTPLTLDGFAGIGRFKNLESLSVYNCEFEYSATRNNRLPLFPSLLSFDCGKCQLGDQEAPFKMAHPLAKWK